MVSERHPVFDKCICCYRLSKSKAVKVNTYLFIIYFIISSGFLLLQFDTSTESIVELFCALIAIVSLILLLIGIYKLNKSFLKQYKIVYIIIIIIGLIVEIIGFINSFKEFKNPEYEAKIQAEYDDVDYYKTHPELLEKVSVKDTVSFNKKLLTVTAIFIIVLNTLNIYYYITTYVYINELNEEIMEMDETKKLESANLTTN